MDHEEDSMNFLKYVFFIFALSLFASCKKEGKSGGASASFQDGNISSGSEDVGIKTASRGIGSRPGDDLGSSKDSGPQGAGSADGDSSDQSASQDQGHGSEVGDETAKDQNKGIKPRIKGTRTVSGEASESNSTDSDLGDSQVGGATPTLYTPDNGPVHGSGNVIRVNSEAQIKAAIANAQPGHEITLAPGTYNFDVDYTFSELHVTADGEEDARIFFRAEQPGTVTLNLRDVTNFNIKGKFWIFENLKLICANNENVSACNHAFHIYGDADDFILRNNEVIDFSSHVKLNGSHVGDQGPERSFPDRAMFINNIFRNTMYRPQNNGQNVLNIDGGQDHIVRGNILADFAPAFDKASTGIYFKASAKGALIESNIVICKKSRQELHGTVQGIFLGDGMMTNEMCDGDEDQDGAGDCLENGQSQELLVRNNIMMNCSGLASSAGIFTDNDRHSKIYNNTVVNTAANKKAVFHKGHPDFDTYYRNNLLEDGFDLSYMRRPLNEVDNLLPTAQEIGTIFASPLSGDLTLVGSSSFLDQVLTPTEVQYDFCGYPRGAQSDLGAIEYSTQIPLADCASRVKAIYDMIP